MTKVTLTLLFASLLTLQAVAQECPSKTFNNFAYDFMEHTDIQKKFTKKPLLSSYLVDGADEPIKKTELISAKHIKFPIVENKKLRNDMSYHYAIDAPYVIRIFTPGTGVQILYKFEEFKQCWRLIEKEDNSM
jgi:hypothetical protein